MKGYHKISGGCLRGVTEGCDEDNAYLDDQIRGIVHGSIIEQMNKDKTSEFYVVVYKKVR
jgi:hypothetical protein